MVKKKKATLKSLRPVKSWKINVIAISVPLFIALIWAGFMLPVDSVVGVDCSPETYDVRMSIALGEKRKFDLLKDKLLRLQNDAAKKEAEWRKDHPQPRGIIADSYCTPARYSLYVL